MSTPNEEKGAEIKGRPEPFRGLQTIKTDTPRNANSDPAEGHPPNGSDANGACVPFCGAETPLNFQL